MALAASREAIGFSWSVSASNPGTEASDPIEPSARAAAALTSGAGWDNAACSAPSA